MTKEINQEIPSTYFKIDEETKAMGFKMASDMQACSLLRTLAVSKPSGKFLELGTGTGLSTSWILEGMDEHSTLVSVDYDENLLSIARKYLGADNRLELVLLDGEEWINANFGKTFDYIFADTWHGKYLLLDEVLAMLNRGGLYIVDDMLPQDNWPEGHAQKAIDFVIYFRKQKRYCANKTSLGNWNYDCRKKMNDNLIHFFTSSSFKESSQNARNGKYIHQDDVVNSLDVRVLPPKR